MKITIRELRQVVNEELQLHEWWGKKDFSSAMDEVLKDLHDTTKKIEIAHKLAPEGPARAIVAGLHNDLFNKIAEYRKFIRQLKRMSAASARLQQSA